jgi:Tfp pilus assembly protein PilV
MNKLRVKIKNKKACLPVRQACLSESRGFTIIEVLIAGFVLSVGLTGIMSLFASSIRYTQNSRDHIIASELAEEGLELVRNIRDTNFANGHGAFDNNFPTSDKPYCNFKYSDENISDSTKCYSGAFNSSKATISFNGGFYDDSNTTTTKFRRNIALVYDTGSANTATKVTVTTTVWWDNSGSVPTTANCNLKKKCVQVVQDLTNWM